MRNIKFNYSNPELATILALVLIIVTVWFGYKLLTGVDNNNNNIG